MAADADGTILGVRVDHLDEVGAYPQAGSAAGMGALIFTGPYRIPKLSFSTESAFTNTCSRRRTGARGRSRPTCANKRSTGSRAAMGIDPLALRRHNVIQRDQLPHLLPVGLPLDHVSPAETLEQAAAMIDYDEFRRHQQEQFQAGRLLGIGIGLYIEPQAAMGPYAAEPAHIRVQPSGSVDVYLGSGSHGQGIETTTAQLVSEHLGVAFDTVTVHQGDTSETPYAFGTGGSRSGPILGAAIQLAAQELRSKIAAIAAHQLEASEADLEIVDGDIVVRGTPTRATTVAAVAHSAYLAVACAAPRDGTGPRDPQALQDRPAVHLLERLPHMHGRDRLRDRRGAAAAVRGE